MTPSDAVGGRRQPRALLDRGVVAVLPDRRRGRRHPPHRPDAGVGSPGDPATYAPGHFAAQFMKRDRSNASVTATAATGANNTGAVGGYDAYFGTYAVDPGTGQVAHTLLGALTPGNVGMTVSRTLTVDGDRLEIRLDTTTPEGEPVTRTLVWKRIG